MQIARSLTPPPAPPSARSLALTLRFVVRGLTLILALSSAAALAQTFPAIVQTERQITLSAERAGNVTKLAVIEGSRVKANDLLLQVDSRDIDAQLAIKRLRRQHLQADIKDVAQLASQGLTNDREVTTLRNEEAIVYTDIILLKKELAHAQVLAPYAGSITQLFVKQHEWVQAGQAVLELSDNSKVTLATSLPEHIAVRISPGQVYQAVIVALGTPIEATVQRILPKVEIQSGTIKVILSIPNPGRTLWPGMRAALTLPPL